MSHHIPPIDRLETLYADLEAEITAHQGQCYHGCTCPTITLLTRLQYMLTIEAVNALDDQPARFAGYN